MAHGAWPDGAPPGRGPSGEVLAAVVAAGESAYPTTPARALNAAELDILRWTNLARQEAGLSPLRPDPALMRAAQAKCHEVVATGRVAHSSARWASAWQLQRAWGVALRVMGGENLACHHDPARACFALLASPAHRANVLHPEHNRIGICVLPFKPRGVAVCEEFGGV